MLRGERLSCHPIHLNLPLAHSGLRQIKGGLHPQHGVGLDAKGFFKKNFRRPVLDTGLGFFFLPTPNEKPNPVSSTG